MKTGRLMGRCSCARIWAGPVENKMVCEAKSAACRSSPPTLCQQVIGIEGRAGRPETRTPLAAGLMQRSPTFLAPLQFVAVVTEDYGSSLLKSYLFAASLLESQLSLSYSCSAKRGVFVGSQLSLLQQVNLSCLSERRWFLRRLIEGGSSELAPSARLPVATPIAPASCPRRPRIYWQLVGTPYQDTHIYRKTRWARRPVSYQIELTGWHYGK